MRRMDPHFEAAFSNEFPEAYGATRRNRRRRGPGSISDATIAVHVPVIPPLISRFLAGVLVMLLLIAAFLVISEQTGNGELGIPSGRAMSASAGSEFTAQGASEALNRVSQEEGAPLRDVVQGLGKNWTVR